MVVGNSWPNKYTCIELYSTMKVIDKNLAPRLHYSVNNHHKYNDHAYWNLNEIHGEINRKS